MNPVPVLAALAPLLSLAACKAPPDARQPMPRGDPERGRIAMERVGCGACHDIPGVWPRGKVGPALDRFAQQSLIAGRLPNRPDRLALFLRDAPSLVPGTAMPAMPMTEEEAHDAAAYLYSLRHR